MMKHSDESHRNESHKSVEVGPPAESPPSWLLQRLLDDIPSEESVGQVFRRSVFRQSEHSLLRLPLIGGLAAVAAVMCFVVCISSFYAKSPDIASLPASVQPWETDPCYVLPPTSF